MERFIKLNNLFFEKFQGDYSTLGFMVILMFYAKHKDNEGIILYDREYISNKLSISDITLRRVLKKLKDMNEIEIIKKRKENYIHIVNYETYIDTTQVFKNEHQSVQKRTPKCSKMNTQVFKNEHDSLYIYNTNVYNKNDNKNVLIQKEKEKEKVFSGSGAKLIDNINTESLTKEKEKPAKEKETSMENNSNFYEKENSNENPKKRYCDEFADEQNSENTTSGYTNSGVYQTNTHRLTPEDVKYKPTPEEINYTEYVCSTINSYVPSEQFKEFVSDFNDIELRRILRWVKEFYESETKCNKDHLLDIKGDGSLFQRKLIKHLNNYIKVCYKKYKKSIAGHNVI